MKVEVLEAKLKYCKAQVRLVEMELDLKDSEKKLKQIQIQALEEEHALNMEYLKKKCHKLDHSL